MIEQIQNIELSILIAIYIAIGWIVTKILFIHIDEGEPELGDIILAVVSWPMVIFMAIVWSFFYYLIPKKYR